MPLKTIYQLEELTGNIDKKYTSLNPWVKLLNCSNIIIEKIGDVTTEGEVVLTFPLGIKVLKYYFYDTSVERYTKKILNILDKANIIILNEGLEKNHSKLFQNLENLVIIEISSTLKKIDAYSFSNCENLQEVILNEGLEEIRDGAFYNCINLKKIKIPETVKKIGNDVFINCGNLQEVILNEGLEKIGGGAFLNCRNIKKMEIPSTVKSIEMHAFEDCENLRYVSVPAKNFNGMSTLFDDCLDKQINLQIRGIEIEDRCLKNYLSGNLDKIDIINIMDEEIVVVHYKTRSNKIYKIISEIKLKIEEYKRYKNNEIYKVKKITL